jgi:arylsulfatase A-like enzyme
MDFFTTIMDLAQIKSAETDGKSLKPVLEESGNLTRNELFWHYPHYHGSAWKPGSALRVGDWKLLVHYEDNKFELFNLSSDPSETTDVSNEYPQKLSEMTTKYLAWIKETNAKLPEKNPNYLQSKK